jgi:AcrR family transcriptional regulator
MSRKLSKSTRKNGAQRKGDQRVVRTRDVLGDALVELMHEKPFADITVQHVLDRAGVSRSTFYTHYTGKDDLFLGDVDDFWEMTSTALARRGEKTNRVAPVRELFTHIAEAQPFFTALVASGKINDVMDLGRGHFAREIEKKLKQLPQPPAIAPERSAALAHMFAGALFSALNWWVNRGMKESPAEMDDLYHQIVWASVSAPAGPL